MGERMLIIWPKLKTSCLPKPSIDRLKFPPNIINRKYYLYKIHNLLGSYSIGITVPVSFQPNR